MNNKEVSPAEIVRKVETGELPSCTYHSITEYVKAMET